MTLTMRDCWSRRECKIWNLAAEPPRGRKIDAHSLYGDANKEEAAGRPASVSGRSAFIHHTHTNTVSAPPSCVGICALPVHDPLTHIDAPPPDTGRFLLHTPAKKYLWRHVIKMIMHKCESGRRRACVRFIYLCILFIVCCLDVRVEFYRWAAGGSCSTISSLGAEQRPFGRLISGSSRFSEGKQANLFIGPVWGIDPAVGEWEKC